MVPPYYVKTFVSWISTDIKKTGTLAFKNHSKNWFLEVYLEESPGGWYLDKLCQNICLLNIYWYKKNTGTLTWAVQKSDFWGPHFWGSSWGSGQKNFQKTNLQLNNFTQKLGFDVLWFRKKKSVQDLGKKKEKNRKPRHS